MFDNVTLATHKPWHLGRLLGGLSGALRGYGELSGALVGYGGVGSCGYGVCSGWGLGSWGHRGAG